MLRFLAVLFAALGIAALVTRKRHDWRTLRTDNQRLRHDVDALRARLNVIEHRGAEAVHDAQGMVAAILLNTSVLVRMVDDVLPVLDEYAQRSGDFSLGGKSYSEARERLPTSARHIREASERLKAMLADLRDVTRNQGAGSI